jgi:hypothetical protein
MQALLLLICWAACGGLWECGGDGDFFPSGLYFDAPQFLIMHAHTQTRTHAHTHTHTHTHTQVQLFILAGYETTANALAFAVYCIATHPEGEVGAGMARL